MRIWMALRMSLDLDNIAEEKEPEIVGFVIESTKWSKNFILPFLI